MSTEKRKGTLKEPAKPENGAIMEIETNAVEEVDNTVDAESDEVDMANNLRDAAETVMMDIMDLEVNKWVIVSYEEELYPGIVKSIDKGKAKVQCMHHEIRDKNCYIWPSSNDEHHYMYSDIICRIQPPEISGVSAKNKRRHTYKIADTEYDAISN